MVACGIFRRIGDRDLEAALSRHEEAHCLRERAEIERGHPARLLEHDGLEPGLLVDGRADVLELQPRERLRRLPLRREDEALDLAPAERDEHAPAGADLREFRRYAVGVGLRDALDRHIDKDLGGQDGVLQGRFLLKCKEPLIK